MNMEIDIPDRYKALLDELAYAWFYGDVTAYIRYISFRIERRYGFSME